MIVTQTPIGADWVKKALSPSHPTIKIRGIPDMYSGNTAFVEYRTRYRLAMPSDWSPAPTSWGASVSHSSSPVAPLCVKYLAPDGSANGPYTLYNSMAGDGQTANARVASWMAKVERARLVYGSVTANLDAPATASQGSWMAASVPSEPQVRTVSGVITTAQAAGAAAAAAAKTPSSASVGALATNASQICYLCSYYSEADYIAAASRLRMQPSYAYGVMAPGADNGGCYAVTTLDPIGRWVGQREQCAFLTTDGGVLPDVEAADGVFPYFTGVDEGGNAVGGFTPAFNDATGLHPGQVGLPLSNLTSSHILFEGLSPEATVILDVIQGWEVVSVPNGPYMPFVQQSPLCDPIALELYQVIQRQLAGNYPACYNDMDKLWDLIRKAAKVALPIIGMMGPVGAAISAAGSAIVGVLPSRKTKKTDKSLVTTRSTVVGSGGTSGSAASGSSSRSKRTGKGKR